MPEMSISERIVAAANHLETLRLKHADQALNGEDFDAGEILNAQAQLDALRDAADEKIRRDREAASLARSKARNEQKTRVKELERKRIEALQEAEESARELAKALERTLTLTGGLAAAVHEITGESVPIPINSREFERRLSNRLSSVLSTCGNRGGRFGNLLFRVNTHRPDESWAAEENRLLEPHLKSILEK